MKVGVPRERKIMEFRVGMVPDGARQLARAGHDVQVEHGAGEGSGFTDAEYEEAGARLGSAEEAWDSELVVKVKEPQPEEFPLLRPGQTLFTYLHLAAAPQVAEALREAAVVAIGYETIRQPDGSFPVLAPMSEVAGRLAVQVGVHLLQKDQGGKGVLLGGVPGVGRGKVTVLGAGMVGINAVRVAHALGAEVDVLDIDLPRLTYVYDIFRGEISTLFSNPLNVERSVVSSDLVVGGVYLSGRLAPTLVTEGMIRDMEPGSVVVDVAVDQGGCVETIRPTTHADPTYRVHDVIHYGVANMPGAVPRTATFALTNTTLPYVEHMTALGIEEAVRRDPSLRHGANVWRGAIVHPGVAESLECPYQDLETLL